MTTLCVDCDERRSRIRQLRDRCYQRRRKSGVELPARKHLSFGEILAGVCEMAGDACWDWPGTIGTNGYGYATVVGRKVLAHRAAYEVLVGPIPTGLTLDHLCMNRRCVKPGHLDPCTGQENTRRSPFTLPGANIRKTVCPQGHPYAGRNLIIDQGKRKCRTCVYARNRRRKLSAAQQARRIEQQRVRRAAAKEGRYIGAQLMAHVMAGVR